MRRKSVEPSKRARPDKFASNGDDQRSLKVIRSFTRMLRKSGEAVVRECSLTNWLMLERFVGGASHEAPLIRAGGACRLFQLKGGASAHFPGPGGKCHVVAGRGARMERSKVG